MKSDYKYLGKEATFYDGMITCSTLPGQAVCKVFCNNDLCMAVMKRHAKFIRYSDLVDGTYCHDEIIKQ